MSKFSATVQSVLKQRIALKRIWSHRMPSCASFGWKCQQSPQSIVICASSGLQHSHETRAIRLCLSCLLVGVYNPCRRILCVAPFTNAQHRLSCSYSTPACTHTLYLRIHTHTTHGSNNMSEHNYKFNIAMSCGGCSGAVERVLKKLEGGCTPLLVANVAINSTQASSRTTSPSRTRPPTSSPKTRSPTKPCSRRSRRPARQSSPVRPMALRGTSKDIEST